VVNGHLSSGRWKPSARAVLIAFGAGEVPERRANLPSPQMIIDRFLFVEPHFRLHPIETGDCRTNSGKHRADDMIESGPIESTLDIW